MRVNKGSTGYFNLNYEFVRKVGINRTNVLEN